MLGVLSRVRPRCTDGQRAVCCSLDLLNGRRAAEVTSAAEAASPAEDEAPPVDWRRVLRVMRLSPEQAAAVVEARTTVENKLLECGSRQEFNRNA